MSLHDIARAAIMEHIAERQMEILKLQDIAAHLGPRPFCHDEGLIESVRAVPHTAFSVGAVVFLFKAVLTCHITVCAPFTLAHVLDAIPRFWLVQDRHDDTAAPAGGAVLVRLVHDASRREVWLFVTAPPSGAAPGDAA